MTELASKVTETKVACANCQTEITAKVPQLEIINKPEYSLVMFLHPEPIICKACGAAYSFFVAGFKGLKMGWQPVELAKTEPEADIVVTGTMPNISMADLLKKKGD